MARTLEGFGVRLQYSVIECPLDGVRLAKLPAELQPILKEDEEQVLFVSLRDIWCPAQSPRLQES
jgi:CRISPR-associated endonuclease Cas2